MKKNLKEHHEETFEKDESYETFVKCDLQDKYNGCKRNRH